MIRYLLFDLDNTLYPASCGLGLEMDTRMTNYVADELGLDHDAALRQRRLNARLHGSTLRWLLTEGMVDVERFLAAVHPRDIGNWLSMAHADQAQAVMSNIDLPASILTNAPKEHAERVLAFLGIRDHFEYIFDVRATNYTGKPAESAYLYALNHIGAAPRETLLVDDVLQYLVPFRHLGGHVVHLSATGPNDPDMPTIRSLRELIPIVNAERSR
jgi:putative hydrolase of the HAD superfamily